MLTIIISSYQPHYYLNLEKNIAETIGIPYEMIKIDNHGAMGICEAYNKGAKKAQYNFLLFLHEDVFFETQDWGKALVNLLKEEKTGCIGVAGSNYYGYVPASWWQQGYKKIHLIQAGSSSKEKISNIRANFRDNISLEKVKPLDGVFLACRREVYQEFPFDENVKGFHGYDLVFSLKISKKYQNYVTDKILLTHYSQGTLNKQWLEGILKVREIIGCIEGQVYDKELERKNFDYLLLHFKKHDISKYRAIRLSFKYLNPKVIGLKNCLKIILRLRYLF